MSTAVTRPLALDANVFLAIFAPETTVSGEDNVRGSERLFRAMASGLFTAVTPAIVLAEIRWVFARNKRADHLRAYHTLVSGMANQLEIVPVTAPLAFEAGALRGKYYSRANDMSYADALYLATAVECGAAALISTDRHLLAATEVPVVEPKEFPRREEVSAWLTQLQARHSTGETRPRSRP